MYCVELHTLCMGCVCVCVFIYMYYIVFHVYLRMYCIICVLRCMACMTRIGVTARAGKERSKAAERMELREAAMVGPSRHELQPERAHPT